MKTVPVGESLFRDYPFVFPLVVKEEESKEYVDWQVRGEEECADQEMLDYAVLDYPVLAVRSLTAGYASAG